MVKKNEKKAYIKIYKELCKGCGLCVRTCPQKLLTLRQDMLNKKGYHFAEFRDSANKCTGCGFCYFTCPDFAIEVYKRKVRA